VLGLPTLGRVELLRPRLDRLAFVAALALLTWPAVGFVSERNGAAAIMCAMCLAGLVAGRIAGVPGRVLLPVAFGLTLVLALVWIGSPVGWRKTSALAHLTGGTLAGWALVEALRRRIRDPVMVVLVAIAAVIALTLVWELGEYVGDRLLDTALQPSLRDSEEDIFFGTAGGLLGIALGALVALRARATRGPGR
jgi:hypothetical protein